MRARAVPVLVAAAGLAAGCHGATSLIVDVATTESSTPAALYVSLYDAHGPLFVRNRLAVQQLPGSIVIDQLPDVAQPLRLVLASDASPAALAGVAVTPAARARTRVSATLSTQTPDQDGDGVPDAVDDCPGVPNPQQLDAVGDGIGDDCRVAGPDLAGIDNLPGTDLAPDGAADLGGQDLAPPPSNCAAVTGALCDGFENGFAGFWALTQNVGAISVDTTRAYRGTHAAKVHTDALAVGMSADVRLRESTTTATNPTDIYVREFIYVPSVPASGAQLLSVVQNVSPYLGEGFSLDKAGVAAAYDSLTGGSYVKSAVAVPLDRWVCLQFQVHLATDTTGYLRIFLDGSELTALRTSEPTQPSPAVHDVSVGAVLYNPQVAVSAWDYWLDEVEIGTSPIACTD